MRLFFLLRHNRSWWALAVRSVGSQQPLPPRNPERCSTEPAAHPPHLGPLQITASSGSGSMKPAHWHPVSDQITNPADPHLCPLPVLLALRQCAPIDMTARLSSRYTGDQPWLLWCTSCTLKHSHGRSAGVGQEAVIATAVCTGPMDALHLSLHAQHLGD